MGILGVWTKFDFLNWWSAGDYFCSAASWIPSGIKYNKQNKNGTSSKRLIGST